MAVSGGYQGQKLPDSRRRTQLDLDVRGILALMSVTGLFGIVFTQLAQSVTVQIPPEVAGTVGAAIGFYFGGKGAGGSEQVIAAQVQAAQTAEKQGLQLSEVHELVNAPFEALKSDVKRLEALIVEKDKRLEERKK